MARRVKKKKTEAKSYRRVKSLLKHLKAYGRGADACELREAFAKRCGTTLAYVVQIAYGYRHASATMAADIERTTHGLVRAEEMRPDIDWAYLRHSTARMAPINASAR